MEDTTNQIKIITVNDINNYLSISCDAVESIEEGEKIATALFRVLTDANGAGLAANQIGIRKKVFVVKVKEPMYFINPVITPIESAGKFVYLETCLSIPMRVCRTERWKSIAVQADNIEGTSIYDISHVHVDDIMESQDALEIAVIQHEADHLNGMLMTYREYTVAPIRIERTPDRNDRIIIKRGEDIKKIKYKHLDEYTSQGWIYEEI